MWSHYYMDHIVSRDVISKCRFWMKKENNVKDLPISSAGAVGTSFPHFPTPPQHTFWLYWKQKKKSKTNKNLSCDSAHLLSPWRRRKNHFPFQLFMRWFTKKKKRKKKKQSKKNIRVKRRHFLFDSLAKCFCFVFCFLHFFTKCIRHRDRISTEIFLINRISWINQTIHFIILANEKSISGSILHCTHIGVK